MCPTTPCITLTCESLAGIAEAMNLAIQYHRQRAYYARDACQHSRRTSLRPRDFWEETPRTSHSVSTLRPLYVDVPTKRHFTFHIAIPNRPALIRQKRSLRLDHAFHIASTLVTYASIYVVCFHSPPCPYAYWIPAGRYEEVQVPFHVTRR